MPTVLSFAPPLLLRRAGMGVAAPVAVHASGVLPGVALARRAGFALTIVATSALAALVGFRELIALWFHLGAVLLGGSRGHAVQGGAPRPWAESAPGAPATTGSAGVAQRAAEGCAGWVSRVRIGNERTSAAKRTGCQCVVGAPLERSCALAPIDAALMAIARIFEAAPRRPPRVLAAAAASQPDAREGAISPPCSAWWRPRPPLPRLRWHGALDRAVFRTRSTRDPPRIAPTGT
jgi:hypothetical protein